MKRPPACLLFAPLLMTALSCSRGEPPGATDGTEHPARVSTPVWVHAKVQYTTRISLSAMHSASNFSVEFYQRMLVVHDDRGFFYAPPQNNDSSPFGLQGLVTATGTLDREAADGSWNRGTFDKRATLTEASYPAQASCDVALPVDPSAAGPFAAGAQLQISLACSAVVTGVQEVRGATADGADRPLQATAATSFPPIFLGCDDHKGPYPSAPTLASVCRFDFTLLPASAPHRIDPANRSTNAPTRNTAGAAPPGLAGAAPPGPTAGATLYGAVTEWLPNGHFVLHFTGDSHPPAVGPDAALVAVEATVWSTAPGDAWRPQGLPRLPRSTW